ncbi:hypothetical protein OF117_18805 [Geodermatophilus sp. YIM 151500]|uniref:DUF7712 family protein n=1 Tax=Geodermatophilus sp. YIM 151500 TaxID=2984531 RepID=UPI0021E3DE55|nr:hypothetical protein [Geodermatophilus sp. YIM 151500]MCV2491401.1 hypothetical protein [Geodermatophilus sp. YIM 151500]
MNWIWDLRSRDGGMNGLEFARATTAGGFRRVLVHAAPAQLSVSVTTDRGEVVVRGDSDRTAAYSPITLLELAPPDRVDRAEVWPDPDHVGLPVLLPGGEVGVLLAWEHADDHSWWRWSVEFSNHTGRPADWAPPGQRLQR